MTAGVGQVERSHLCEKISARPSCYWQTKTVVKARWMTIRFMKSQGTIRRVRKQSPTVARFLNIGKK